MTEQLKVKISILSQLANADGVFDIRELAFIYNVCLRNNIGVDAVADIISQPEPVISLSGLTADEQAQYLTDVLLLMMIDGKVLPGEIQFSVDIGERLGYDPAAVRSFIGELGEHSVADEAYVRSRVYVLPRLMSR